MFSNCCFLDTSYLSFHSLVTFFSVIFPIPMFLRIMVSLCVIFLKKYAVCNSALSCTSLTLPLMVSFHVWVSPATGELLSEKILVIFGQDQQLCPLCQPLNQRVVSSRKPGGRKLH